jgi:hypothetical protein
MPRLTAIWFLCLGLGLTRLLGLHAHACAGLEGAGHEHEAPHYADAGFLFGEFHAGDHPDNLELELSSALPSAKFQFDLSLDDPALPESRQLNPVASSGWLTVRAPRGPPEAHEARPDHFAPPLRGPPSHSLA